MPDFTMAELMVTAAAREIKDGDWVFVGMRLPLLAFIVAQKLHAPKAVAFYENGVVRTTPAEELLFTMGDSPNLFRATNLSAMTEVMGYLQSGRISVGFLGAGQADRYGNLNSSYVKENGKTTRLPGSGGACDIACLAQRVVVMLEHSKKRLPERVDYVTSPGWGLGDNWRRKIGLPRGGPEAVITDKAILRFDPKTHEAHLANVHPGFSVREVKEETGWNLKVAADAKPTPPPTPQELEIIRGYDKERFWTA